MTDPIAVLIVENDALIRGNIAQVLEDDGFKVHECDSSADALVAMESNIGADCLLTDVDLGKGIDGLDLASIVHDHWPDVGIIVVSGKPRTMPVDVPNAKFFIKPYDPEKIADMIRELVLNGEQT